MAGVTTSATGGFLTPGSGWNQTEEDDALHDLIAALCDLPGDLVRPRWEPRSQRQPDPGTDWAAFGVTGRDAPGAQTRHEETPDGLGRSIVETHETLDVLVSFYGPHARDKAIALREGLCVEQNRAELRERVNIALVRAEAVITVSELVNMRWVRRQDLTLTLRRGPAHRERNRRPEGQINVRHLTGAQACGLCGRSR